MNSKYGAHKMCDQLSRRVRARAVASACSILLGWTLAGSLHAGSVFMKNGYIIQGEVVDRDEESIVLGWSNGKVAIAWRFIEEVSLDPDEEQNLVELEAMRKQIEHRATVDEQITMLAETESTPDLPATLDSFLQTYDLLPRSRSTENPDGLPLGPTDVEGPEPVVVADPSGADAVVVTDVTPEPADTLGEPISSSAWRVSFQPPGGWTEQVTPEALRFVSTDSTGAVPASLTVQRVPVGPLESSDYVALLKAEHSRLLAGHEVLSTGWREVGGERAFEIVSRGQYAGRSGVVRQCLVVQDNDVWLISAFTGDDEADGDFGRIEKSLATFDFLIKSSAE